MQAKVAAASQEIQKWSAKNNVTNNDTTMRNRVPTY